MIGMARFPLLTLVLTGVAGAALRADPIPEPIPPAPVEIGLETVATGLTAPNWGTFAPGHHPRSFFVTDQDGILWQMDTENGNKRVFLDVSSAMVALGDFDERGLLGLAFHPDYASNGLFYLYLSVPASAAPDFSTMPEGVSPNHQSAIVELAVATPADLLALPDPASARVLMRIDQPQGNHNAGALAFGPDGMLYVSLGDGGGSGDQGVGHGEIGNGQDPGTVLGAILRIDPLGDNAANGQYGVPPDNPFATQVGITVGGQQGCDDGFCDEIFAYGFRNPFRFSFDRVSGVLVAADVGQNDIEEIDVVVPGGNYGWNLKEGSFCFDPGQGVRDCAPGEVPPDLIDPVVEYDHDEGVAVIGGFVYRGRAAPRARGLYLFGDHARNFLSGGRLFVAGANLPILELRIAGQGDLGLKLLGFGEDATGEVYVLANVTAGTFGKSGVVLRLVPASP